MNVEQLKTLLNALIKEGAITNKSEVWLSSDEEGNEYSPLVAVNGQYNISVEPDKSKITLYPISM